MVQKMVLKRTEHTQPAIFLISIILGKLFQEKVGNPIVSAGHSLGEYSALTIANAFDFDEGMKLIKVRSEQYERSMLSKKGTMAAIIGFDDIILKELCDNYKGNGDVVIANYNSPNQTIISGSIEAVSFIIEKSKFWSKTNKRD